MTRGSSFAMKLGQAGVDGGVRGLRLLLPRRDDRLRLGGAAEREFVTGQVHRLDAPRAFAGQRVGVHGFLYGEGSVDDGEVHGHIQSSERMAATQRKKAAPSRMARVTASPRGGS